MLLLDHRAISSLLPMRECMDVMTGALVALAEGRVLLPLRQVLRLPDSPNAFATMPAFASALDGNDDALGVKVITVFPGNEATPYDSHQGAILLFEPRHGQLVALLDASSITAIRTAAVSGVATRLLAREGAGDLAILGTGVQATTHLDAMCLARPVSRVRVWSRSAARRERFAERARTRHAIPVEVCASAREAVDGADLICTVTAAREPVLEGSWIADGAHINAVGASLPTARELDSDAVARARLYVDRRESAVNEAGDFLIPKREGRFGDEHIVAELGELLTGRAPGRRSATEITLFKSLGLAIEDLAAARHVYERAVATREGERVELGGLRDA